MRRCRIVPQRRTTTSPARADNIARGHVSALAADDAIRISSSTSVTRSSPRTSQLIDDLPVVPARARARCNWQASTAVAGLRRDRVCKPCGASRLITYESTATQCSSGTRGEACPGTRAMRVALERLGSDPARDRQRDGDAAAAGPARTHSIPDASSRSTRSSTRRGAIRRPGRRGHRQVEGRRRVRLEAGALRRVPDRARQQSPQSPLGRGLDTRSSHATAICSTGGAELGAAIRACAAQSA